MFTFVSIKGTELFLIDSIKQYIQYCALKLSGAWWRNAVLVCSVLNALLISHVTYVWLYYIGMYNSNKRIIYFKVRIYRIKLQYNLIFNFSKNIKQSTSPYYHNLCTLSLKNFKWFCILRFWNRKPNKKNKDYLFVK